MKTTILKISALGTVALLLIFSCSKEKLVIRQGPCIPFYISDTYNFPVRPGSEEWKKLGSLNEMVQVCQIPAKKLSSISTEGLLETLLNYPLILDWSAFNMRQDGFNRIKTENNGFSVLYSRQDIFEVITQRYALMSLDCDKNIYPPFVADQAAPIEIALQTFEFFMFQDEFLNKLSVESKIKIFDMVYDKLRLKTEHGFTSFDMLVSAAILGKIMYQNNYAPFVEIYSKTDYLSFFIQKIPNINYSSLEIIEEYSKKYRNER